MTFILITQQTCVSLKDNNANVNTAGSSLFRYKSNPIGSVAAGGTVKM